MQSRLLSAVLDRVAADGFQPSVKDLAKVMKFKSMASVHQLLRRMERRGYVRVVGESRAIRVLRLPNGDEFRGFQLRESAR